MRVGVAGQHAPLTFARRSAFTVSLPLWRADHRKRDDRLFTIKDVAADMRVSERTLRDVIATLGFRRPPGRKRYLFNAAQVALIREALQCRATIPMEPESEYGAGLTAADMNRERKRLAESVRQRLGMSSRALARETREINKEIRMREDTESGKVPRDPTTRGKWNVRKPYLS